MSAFEYFVDLAKALHLSSIDTHEAGRPFKDVSKSELKRWMERGMLEVDGKLLKDWKNDRVFFPITSLVLFPNNKRRRCTIF